jgi:hypothetical protein
MFIEAICPWLPGSPTASGKPTQLKCKVVFVLFCFVLRQGCITQHRLALNFPSSSLSLLSPGISGMYHLLLQVQVLLPKKPTIISQGGNRVNRVKGENLQIRRKLDKGKGCAFLEKVMLTPEKLLQKGVQ